jgi:hypothetical protein
MMTTRAHQRLILVSTELWVLRGGVLPETGSPRNPTGEPLVLVLREDFSAENQRNTSLEKYFSREILLRRTNYFSGEILLQRNTSPEKYFSGGILLRRTNYFSGEILLQRNTSPGKYFSRGILLRRNTSPENFSSENCTGKLRKTLSAFCRVLPKFPVDTLPQ